MDSSFVEHVLERARERQKKIDQLKTIEKVPQNKHNKTLNQTKKCIPESTSNSKQPEKTSTHDEKIADCNTAFNSEGRVQKVIRHNSSTKITSKLPASPQAQTKTLNIQKENFNMEIKLISSDDVRVEVEIQEGDTSNEEITDEIKDGVTPGLRDHAKYKLKKLGRLYAGGEDADISSPIQKTEEHFLTEVNVSPSNLVTKKNSMKPNPKRGLSKLADLAENIKQREDETNFVKSNKSNTSKTQLKKLKSLAPQPPKNNEDSLPEITPALENNLLKTPMHKNEISSVSSLEANNSNNEKALELDQEILNTLEQQGFTRTTSNSRLIYNYNPQTQSHQNDENNPKLYAEKSISRQERLQPIMDDKEQAVTNAERHPVENSDKYKLVTSKKFSPNEIKKEENKFTPRSPKKNVQSAIANKTAIFESSPNKLNSDPALMSLAERKALFEKNKGNALIPKAAFAMPIPLATKENKVKINADNKSTTTKTTKWNLKNSSNKEMNEKPNTQLNNVSNNNKQANDVNETGGIASKIAALINNKNTISEEQISHKIKEQKQKDMEVLLNRFNKNKYIKQEIITSESKISSPQTLQVQTPQISSNNEIKEEHTPDRRSGEKRTKKGDSPHVAAVLEDVKRVKVTQPKDGHLYPSLSDIETANETETEQAKSPSCNNSEEESFCSSDGDANTSFGRDILQAICKKQTPQKRPILEEESTASDVSDILDDMDDYLDEAMGNEIFDNNSGPTPPKLGKVLSKENESNLSKPSNSFHYKNFSPSVNRNVTPHKKSPLKRTPSPNMSSEIPTHVVDGDNILPLTHTVSFYRRQQTPVKTLIRQVTRQPHINEEVEQETDSENEIVLKKIQELLDQINKQQMFISQTSQALNLCNATLEFMGSTEQVEAEKLLLLATHRRQACLHEVQRLKVEGTLRPQGQHAENIPLEKGNLVISNIVLPMKKEYVRALAAAGGKGHHVVCLIKCGEQVLSTQLVSTVATSTKNPDHDLYIPGSVKVNDIYSDFTVTFEVYGLQAQEEILPHDIKYHINKKGSSKLTPKKTKQESRMILPPKESPAGPQAVRSSSFALMGYVIFSIQSISKTHWTLNKAPSMSPLEGRVDMKISCDMNVSVEYKGFLTMFEDISGFGAWHRRWCMLKGSTLSYWKYPDDEKKKVPIESINLNNSITKEVLPVSREICARMHTFLIETERDAKSSDKESLTLIRKGDKTVKRHLLSADTKEERIEWCQMFNKALTALKMWGKN